MNRLVFVVLLSLSSASFAGPGNPTPLCTSGSPPNCVVPNWGVIQPGATDDASIATGTPSLAAVPVSPRSRMAVQMMPTAASAASAASRASDVPRPIKSVVSPQNLFPKETAALLAALSRARFDDDGSIRSGEAAIRRAAAATAKSAGDKYTLTLFIKVPQKLQPDRSEALGRKVDALNAVLANPSDAGQGGTPRS